MKEKSWKHRGVTKGCVSLRVSVCVSVRMCVCEGAVGTGVHLLGTKQKHVLQSSGAVQGDRRGLRGHRGRVSPSLHRDASRSQTPSLSVSSRNGRAGHKAVAKN